MWRQRRRRLRPTLDTIEGVDALLEQIRKHRLPKEDRAAVAFLLFRGEDKAEDCLTYFLAGYDWGRDAGIFYTGSDSAVSEEVSRAAAAYDARADPRTDVGSLNRAQALLPAVEGALPAMSKRLITNADATPYGSADEAFEAAQVRISPNRAEQSGERSAFHAGAGFYAFETALLHELEFLGRLSNVRK
jgi:hypothetical protein